MSKWDKYKVSEPVNSSTNKWDKYKIAAKPKESSGDSWPALIGKSALKGLSTVADIPRIAVDTLEGTINLGRKTKGNPAEQYWTAMNGDVDKFNESKITIDKNASQSNLSRYVPSTEDIRKGVKKYTGVDLEPKPNSPAQRIVAHGADFGASMAPWALPAKGGNLFSKFKNVAKATKGATAVGLGSGVLQETGINPLAADLISSIATPNIKPAAIKSFDTVRTAPKKLFMHGLGLGPNKFDAKAAQAAKDLGIDLPLSVYTDSVLPNLADQMISKTPIFGDILKNKWNKAQEQTYTNLEKIYNSIGPDTTPDTFNKRDKLYDRAKNLLPKDVIAKTLPSDTVNAVNNISTKSVNLNDDEKTLYGALDAYKKAFDPVLDMNVLNRKIDPAILAEHGSIKLDNIKLPLKEVEIEALIDSKKSINGIIPYDRESDDLKKLVPVQRGMVSDISRYGETNPKWHKEFKKAELFNGTIKKRKKTERFLRNQGTTGDASDLSHAVLSKAINNKENKKLLEKNSNPEAFEKILKLGEVSRAVLKKSQRSPNPSGTATTLMSLGYITGLFFDPVTTLKNTPAAAVVAAAGATKLLTDKRFIDLGLKYAEEHGKAKLATGMQLNKRAKEITGYTLNSLGQAAKRTLEDKDGLQ